MQCSCGNDATITTQVQKKLNAELSYYQCNIARCGRVSDAVLRINDVIVAADQGGAPLARMSFNSLTAESARDLSDAAKRLEAPEPRYEQAAFDF